MGKVDVLNSYLRLTSPCDLSIANDYKYKYYPRHIYVKETLQANSLKKKRKKKTARKNYDNKTTPAIANVFHF